MVDHLARLVELESPTDDKMAVDRLGESLAADLGALDAQLERLVQPEAGNHLLARWGEGEGGTLILCHMDTVWDVGTVADRPVRVKGGKLYGPGAFDMKGGIVIGLWALQSLKALDLLPTARVTMLLTADEETGSRTSRGIIEAEAQRHDVVYVLEPAIPPHGALKTWRKGTGGYKITVMGRASHAGADHQRGINALEELAHQVLAVQAFTDYEAGTTFNVGVAAGGSRSNVVPAEAWAKIDVRIAKASEGARVEALMRSLKPHLPGAGLEVIGGLGRPPMERTEKIAALFAQARSLAGEMGLDIAEGGTGGASDGNLTAALGVPTLDGMGAVGDGGHAIDEHVIVSALPERAAVLAAMLRPQA
jgi:glutamate carboxypeptidase